MLPLRRRDVLPLVGGLAVGSLLGSVAHGREAGGKIRVGQIGTGHAHATKLEVFRRSSDYEVVGVVEPDPELRAAAQKLAAYRDLPWLTQEQLLNDPAVRLVLVETKVQGLLDAAESCIAAGKHVHLDKPAGANFSQYRSLLTAAEQKKLLVQMGYMYRYNPGIVMLRDALKRGWLGEIFEVHAVMSKVIPPTERTQLAWHPGGVMFELGCHLIDLVVGLLGKPTHVHASLQHVAKLDDGLQDNTLALFEYAKATATVRSSGLEVNGGQRRHLTVCGTEGTFHVQPLDAPKVRMTLSKPQGPYRFGSQDVNVGQYERYVADAADIARVIRGEKEPDVSYAHDLVVQETLLKACGLSVPDV